MSSKSGSYIIVFRTSMADWHLMEIRIALERSGWRLVTEHSGDNYQISATWEIIRDKKSPSILIDFNGCNDMTTLPIEQSYGCLVRNRPDLNLYFSRKGEKGSDTRERWVEKLTQFVRSLDKI